MQHHNADRIEFLDTIGGTVTIKKVGTARWQLKQRVLKGVDNAQNPTWIRIDNPGATRKIELEHLWADTDWPHWRMFGYQKIGDVYSAVRGVEIPESTTYRLEVPAGISWFGAFPWYTNEDGESFLTQVASQPLCRVRMIGQTARRRPIKCLTIGQDKAGRENVVVFARTHAMETPGSFAVEGITDFLLKDPTGKKLLNRYVFHLFPIVNPDGVAAGLKFTRLGPKEKYDMAVVAMTSEDSTMVALRQEIHRLRPACFIDYHSYPMRIPGIFFFDNNVGIAVLRELLIKNKNTEAGFYYRGMITDNRSHKDTLWAHCFLHYQATVVVVELSWNLGLLPCDVSREGVNMFHATMKAHARRTR